MQQLFLDSADETGLTPLARMRLSAELAGLVKQKLEIVGDGPMAALQRAKVGGKILELLRRLGAGQAQPAAPEAPPAPPPTSDLPARAPTAHLYDFDPNRRSADRRKDNSAAMDLLRSIDRGEVDGAALSDEQKAALARYSGTGGNLVGADGKKGSAYEYYTPKPIAAGAWDLLQAMGFKGGKVLDPCAGVGIFGATAPASAAVEAVELNETSGRVNQLVNGGPSYNAIVSPFEAVASRTPDEIYDAVISNVPFGGVHDRGSNRKIDPRYQDQPLETYFILRSLEKLRPGGLAAFIVPPRVVSAKGGREEQLRIAASYMAEFMGAYRLPNSVFGTADADTITDLIVLRKFSRDAARKIDELKEQAPGVLVDAKVQWTEFISGDYFRGEGRRFVLGEFKAKDPNKFRDVDRVLSDQSVANIAKLLQKFPDSRIDWAMLDASETQPILYNEGDAITMAGQTLEMRGGQWIPVGQSLDTSRFDGLGQVMTSASVAVTNKVTWEDADAYIAHLKARSLELDTPIWLASVHNDVGRQPEAERPKYWGAFTAGLAAVEVTRHHADEVGFNYLEEYPGISEALQAAAGVRRAPAKCSSETKGAVVKATILYDRRTGFSALWRGEVLDDVAGGRVIDESAQVEAIKYNTQGVTVPIQDLRRIYGDTFDHMADDAWCVSADGTMATKADDYYVGNVGDFLARIDAEIAAASGTLRDKLIRQKTMARERFSAVDPATLRFNLFSPYISIEEKVQFLQRFMHPAFAVGMDDEGRQVIICDISSPKTERERQLKRFAEYLKRGTLSTRTTDAEAHLDEMRRKMLRNMAATAGAQFDQWVKANPLIMERLRVAAADPTKLYFDEVDDTTPLHIPGMSDGVALHGYQNAFTRRQARSFGGINGFDVGLGKTFTALACAQYVQSIGVKKKTMFIVPNAVLSNWRREAGRAYASIEDCLFVGLTLDAEGNGRVDSANYARDFTRILENRHAKIFCTLEAFKVIPLREETVTRYEDYLASVDPSYELGERKADNERSESKLADVTSSTGAKSSAVPYFEDMGVDSLVMDEAHMFKNSKSTVDFAGAKFLSVAEASQRGLDVQIKAWFVRGLSPLRDGVLALTATPITNSPLEIYSMLCLAVGEEKVHNLTMGARGADAFMEVMCQIEDDEEATIDGRIKPYRVFRGLQNVELLRKAIGTVATIKTAADVKIAGDDLKLPESPERKIGVRLSAQAKATLEEYKTAYRAARAVLKDEHVEEEDQAALDRVMAKHGESVDLVAHPFNLIRKMSDVIVDPELDERATFYRLSGQKDTAESVVAAFNKLRKIEVRPRPGPWTEDDAVVGTKVIRDGDSETMMVRIAVRAKLTGDGRIVVDTLDTNIQEAFETMAEKAGLVLDCSIPPKLAALLENFRKEEASPRSTSGRVKQLIFCDSLPLHRRLRMLLIKHAGLKSSQIAIVNGQAIKNAEQMQEVQDGFNAEGADNRYRAVIANEKAEVGINLQKGTQAIHHLTIGWTPDSTHQRNGRGVRQGNTTSVVHIYHYDADGTFDEYKRSLTTKKADWIGAVMDNQGGNEVQVAGGLTNDQYDELIQSMGNAEAIKDIQRRGEEREKAARAETARTRQVINLQTIRAQNDFVARHETADQWVSTKVLELFDLTHQFDSMRNRADGKLKADAKVRLEARLSELKAKLDRLQRDIDASATFKTYAYSYATHKSEEVQLNVADFFKKIQGERLNKRREDLANRLKWSVVVIEGSTLAQDWASEVEQARAMVEEAQKDFKRLASGPDGAYPAQLADAFAHGGAVSDGKILARGMFARDPKGVLHVLTSGAKMTHLGKVHVDTADYATRGWAFIMFGTQAYQDAVVEAAKIEDESAQAVDPERREWLFSSIVPEVAALRRTATAITFDRHTCRLPSPYFPYPIEPEARGISDGLRALGEAQRPAIIGWKQGEYAREVYVRADVEATVESRSYSPGRDTTAVRMEALVDWAKGNGQKLTLGDLGYVAWYDSARDPAGYLAPFGDWGTPEAMRSVFADAETEEDVRRLGASEVARAVPWLDLQDVLTYTEVAPYAGRAAFNTALGAIRRKEDLARMEEELAARVAAPAPPLNMEPPPEATPIPVVPPVQTVAPATVGGVAVNSRGKIGIKGNTKPHKDIIKAAALEAGAKAVWLGALETWAVPSEAWTIICTKHPEVSKVLFPVPV